MAKRSSRKPGDDAFLEYLYSFRPGGASDRQRWLAWAAMVTLLARAPLRERRQWHQHFHALSQIEHNEALSEAERGQALVDLLAPLWPRRSRRGRRPEDNSGLLADFPRIRDHLARGWTKGDAARRVAVADVERDANLDLSREIDDEGEILTEVLKSHTPSKAALLILARAYEQDPATVAQGLRRSRQRPPR